ncbi:MAG: NAD+ synthase [Candidatus Bathyarchaeota archaeon]|nr:NAD+ synthase [Candidatus Bathyarchaeota archaeon]
MMKVAMAQINAVVGDIYGNIEKIQEFLELARDCGADIVAFPELAVTGYPPQDLLYEREFVKANKEYLWKLINENRELVGIVGFVDYEDGALYNAAAVFKGNKILAVVHKTLLPTYDVFDETRYFKPSKNIAPVKIDINGEKLLVGVEICEDLWDEEYSVKVTDILAAKGAELIINISASPFYVGKRFVRMKLLQEKSKKNGVPIFYVNLVGGQDELVFDGQSLAVDKTGNLIAVGKQFSEDLVIADLDVENGTAEKVEMPPYCKEQEMFNALVLGVKDYFRKTGFRKAIVGMSGGIDSSLTTCIAVEALGAENVIGVYMPSKYSSQQSKEDAQKLAKNLGILFVEIPIQEIVEAYMKTLERPLEEIRNHFALTKESDDPVADENIQPRIRGNILMDISNRLKELKVLVINTGNKTELALGYCTLYGDMTGGIGALGDVSKLEVYRLARYVNTKAGREIIPENVFKKKPSPELKENQYDPFDFEIVSPLVDDIIEKRKGKWELLEKGYPGELVEDTYLRIKRAEYKRRQAPPCIKITPKAFGIGWKMPIVNRWNGQ